MKLNIFKVRGCPCFRAYLRFPATPEKFIWNWQPSGQAASTWTKQKDNRWNQTDPFHSPPTLLILIESASQKMLTLRDCTNLGGEAPRKTPLFINVFVHFHSPHPSVSHRDNVPHGTWSLTVVLFVVLELFIYFFCILILLIPLEEKERSLFNHNYDRQFHRP